MRTSAECVRPAIPETPREKRLTQTQIINKQYTNNNTCEISHDLNPAVGRLEIAIKTGTVAAAVLGRTRRVVKADLTHVFCLHFVQRYYVESTAKMYFYQTCVTFSNCLLKKYIKKYMYAF